MPIVVGMSATSGALARATRWARVGWERRLAVVTVPAAPVLIGQLTPAKERQPGRGDDAERLQRVDTAIAHHAQVRPVVAEVEHIYELHAGVQPAQGGAPVIQHLRGGAELGVGPADTLADGEGELVQVGTIPTGECVVDGGGELGEGAGGGNQPAGPGPEALAAPFDQLNADRQPATSAAAGSGGAPPVRISCPGGHGRSLAGSRRLPG